MLEDCESHEIKVPSSDQTEVYVHFTVKSFRRFLSTSPRRLAVVVCVSLQRVTTRRHLMAGVLQMCRHFWYSSPCSRPAWKLSDHVPKRQRHVAVDAYPRARGTLIRECSSQATLLSTPSASSGSAVNALSAASLTVIVPAHPHFAWLACEIQQKISRQSRLLTECSRRSCNNVASPSRPSATRRVSPRALLPRLPNER